MIEPTQHEAAIEAAAFDKWLAGQAAQLVDGGAVDAAAETPREWWLFGYRAARAAYDAARGECGHGAAEEAARELRRIATIVDDEDAALLRATADRCDAARSGDEATEFLDSFVTEWLTELGADESQLESVRKRVEFYRLALSPHPEPRQDQPVTTPSDIEHNTYTTDRARGLRTARLAEQDQPVDRASGEIDGPSTYTSRAACPKCGGHECDQLTDRCVECDEGDDAGELAAELGLRPVEHPETGERERKACPNAFWEAEAKRETGERDPIRPKCDDCGHYCKLHGPRGCHVPGCKCEQSPSVEPLQDGGPESCDCDPNAPGYTNRAGVASCSWCDKPLTTRTPSPLRDGGERPETWRVAFNEGDAAEAGQRVEDMLNGDPLRRHTTLTPEQFALDSKLMAKQILANVLAALKGEPRPS